MTTRTRVLIMVLGALKKAQELTVKYSGELPQGEISWKQRCRENNIPIEIFKDV